MTTPIDQHPLGNMAGALTPENARSAAIMAELCLLRPWVTDPEGPVGLGVDSCIASTRIVMEVARYFGLPAVKPVAVSAAAFNAEGFRQYQEWHATPEAERGPYGLQGDEAWAVGINGDDEDKIEGVGHVGGNWSGHLIGRMEDIFIDFSLDQFTRPQRNMQFGATIFPVQSIWEEHDIAIYKRSDGQAIVYRLIPNAVGYQRAPDWIHWRRYKPVVGMLITRIKEALG